MSIPVLSPFDFSKTELLNARLQNLGTDPTGLVAGDKGLMWITGAGAIKYWDGTTIQTVGNASGGNANTLENQNGAYYLSRANHTGTQLAATISDFQTTARAAITVTDTATLDLTYAAGAISAAVLDSPLLGGQTVAQVRARSSHTGTQLASTVSDFDTQVRLSRLDQMAVPTAPVAMNAQKLTGLADGTNTQDAVAYGQLLAVIEGKTWKDPVRVATTANITLSAPQTIDGVSVVAGDRVLVKNQTASQDNGIYLVAAGAWTRTTDFNTAAEANRATVIAQEGTTNQGDVFTQTANVVTLGTTAQTWIKTGEGNQTYAADGTSLTLTGSTFSINTGWVGQAAITTVGTIGTGTWNATAIAANKGGTGQTSYAVGDLLYASGATAIGKLADVAVGQVLKSGGVGAAPAYGQVALATDVSGTLPIGNGGTGATTAPTALAALGGISKFSADVGNGSLTEITVTHNLNSRDVQVAVYRSTTPWDTVMVDVERTDVNNVKVRFATAPASNAYRVVVQG